MKAVWLKPWILLAWLFGAVAYGQSLVSGWQTDSIHGPSQLGIIDSLALDFDGDGDTDVVSVSLDDGHLRAYLNQGGLQFTEQSLATNVLGAFRLVATDLNDDDEIDFVIPSIFTQEIIALLHEPGGYRKQIIAAGVLLPVDAQVAHLNEDALLDVVSLSFEENLVLLHRQLPDGDFKTTVISDLPLRPRKLVLADFNSDERIDIAVVSSDDNALRIFQNQGNNTFSERFITGQLPGTRYANQCDLNGDNLIDLVVSATEANAVVMFTNLGNMLFEPRVLNALVEGANALVCHDLDFDNQAELVSLAGSAGVIRTHELVGEAVNREVATLRDGYSSVQVGYFSGFNPHILTQTYFENRNLLYLPQALNVEQVVWEDFPEGANDLQQADINDDGVPDWVVASFRDDRVQWYDGLTREHHLIAEGIDGAAKVVAVDLDEDGFMDVLSAASFANHFYWHRQSGAGQFTTLVIDDDARFANGLAVGDLNQDGKLDVVGTSGSDDSVRWYDRNGTTFTPHLIDNLRDAPNEVKLHDLDQDGWLDLVVPYTLSDELYVYHNLGGGLFVADQVATQVDRVDSTTLVDLNGDDLIDLLVGVAGDDTVIQLLQQLDGGFVMAPFIESIITPKKLNTNGPMTNRFLFTKTFPGGRERTSVYNISPVVDEGGSLFEFSNTSFNDNHVFIMTLFDLIFNGGFED